MKLNKLLPIVALSGIATVAMPLVTSCNKGGDTPEGEYTPIDKQEPIPGSERYFLRTDEMDFDLSTTYKVTFLWSDLSKMGGKDEKDGWSLGCYSINFEHQNCIDSTFKVYLNDVLITEKLEITDGGISPLEKLNLTDNMRFKVNFTIDPDKFTTESGYITLLGSFTTIWE